MAVRFYKRRVKKYARGDIIFAENSECDGMYIIDKGKVRVYKTIDTNGEQQEVELVILGQRAMFGEMAMIDEEKRSATVQAIEPTECTVITRKIFEDQLSHIPVWMVNMINILVKRLRDTNDKLRQHLEDNTKPINDDPGGLLTLNDEGPVESETSQTGNTVKKKGAALDPDMIIEELFE